MIYTEKIDIAIQSALDDPAINLVLINLFESTTGKDTIAHNIITSYEGVPPDKPIIIRLSGIDAATGLQRIADAQITNVYTETELDQALQTAKELLQHEHTH
jgi:succinyl-CoA synthetase beta subunit